MWHYFRCVLWCRRERDRVRADVRARYASFLFYPSFSLLVNVGVVFLYFIFVLSWSTVLVEFLVFVLHTSKHMMQ